MLTHGASGTRLYNIWCLMRRRCNVSGSQDYALYGERGISICAAWDDFAAFQDWALDHGYQDDLTIDRCDTDGNYEADNCRWITRTAQNRNRRNNIRYNWGGRSMMLSEIAEENGLSYSMLRQRVQVRGWNLEHAISAARDNRGGKRANIIHGQ